MKKWTLILIAMILFIPILGCSLPATAISVATWEKTQIDNDSNLTLGLLNDRVSIVQAKLDNLMRQAIADTKALPPDKLTGQWVAETFQVVEAEQEKLRSEIRALEEIKRVLIKNSDDRKATLDRLTKLVTASQQWNSETASLVTDLLGSIASKK
jgi:hypothetical protein